MIQQIAVVGGVDEAADETRHVGQRGGGGEPPYCGRREDGGAIQPHVAEIEGQAILCQRVTGGGFAQPVQFRPALIEVAQPQEQGSSTQMGIVPQIGGQYAQLGGRLQS